MKTQMSADDSKKLVQQAMGVFIGTQSRTGNINRLTGKMPKIEAAASSIANQSSTTMPIVQTMDLGKGKGDEVKFNFVNPMGGIPIMGSEMAEGRGEGVSLTDDKLRVNQARFPIDLGSVMDEIRSPVDIHRLGKPLLQRAMDEYEDQLSIVHMAGARGFHNNLEWRIPIASDARFNKVVTNRVKAPTKNRHFVVDNGTVTRLVNNAGELDITSGDVVSMGVIDSLTAYLDQLVSPPPPVEFDTDQAAKDSPFRVLLCSPATYNIFSADPNFRTYQSNALARARYAKDHPLFANPDNALWRNTLLVKMPNKPIRFYAGDDIKYCGAFDTETESTCKVPASFADKFAVDRNILLGGQALAKAYAKSRHSGWPYFWKESPSDFDDKLELMIGSILGASKIRFAVNVGDDRIEYTDHGAAVLDAVVPIIGARQ